MEKGDTPQNKQQIYWGAREIHLYGGGLPRLVALLTRRVYLYAQQRGLQKVSGLVGTQTEQGRFTCGGFAAATHSNLRSALSSATEFSVSLYGTFSGGPNEFGEVTVSDTTLEVGGTVSCPPGVSAEERAAKTLQLQPARSTGRAGAFATGVFAALQPSHLRRDRQPGA